MKAHIVTGNNIDVLKTYPDNHFDSVVTDPPYGIDFLGKAWDANTGALETYQQCLRVLKPGGYLLAFSAARTYHHLAVTVEQAGFEIRDQIMWIYSSGFPKSQDVGKSIERSEKKRADNALGIKRSRIESGPKTNCPKCNKTLNGTNQTACQQEQCDLRDALKPADNEWAGWGTCLKPAHEPIVMARKPTRLSFAENVQQWGMGALNIDAGRVPVEGTDTRGGGANGWDRVEFGQAEPNKTDGEGYTPNSAGRFPSNVIGEIEEPYQKYFYCSKVGRAERHIGFDETDKTGNNHPTVKPIELMKYLIKLVTPPGGHILDPFNGSGSTGCAAVELDYEYTGIELDPKYAAIAQQRIQARYEQTHATTFGRLFE
jgi:site-specific DNA-methyltransferase (adenine-specific)